MNYKARCELCNTDGEYVSVQVVRWKSDGGFFEYESMPRCLDRLRCRARVEARGEVWGVEDREDVA